MTTPRVTPPARGTGAAGLHDIELRTHTGWEQFCKAWHRFLRDAAATMDMAGGEIKARLSNPPPGAGMERLAARRGARVVSARVWAAEKLLDAASKQVARAWAAYCRQFEPAINPKPAKPKPDQFDFKR